MGDDARRDAPVDPPVLRCDGCGFDYEAVAAAMIPDALVSVAERLGAAVASTPAECLTRRPDATTWSVLEYACHVRDVLLVQRERVVHALVVDVPRFEPMHRDERAELLGYRDEPPDLVVQELTVAAVLLGTVFDRLTPEQLARRCRYGYPRPMEVDVAWIGRHTVHEGEHHVGDVVDVLERVA